MVRLPDDYQQAMETGSAGIVPAGYYLAECVAEALSDNVGDAGFHSVIMDWVIQGPAWAASTEVRDWISLAPKAAWRMAELFDSCDLTPDSDTEEVVKEQIVLELSAGIQAKGKGAGRPRNSVDHYLPVTDETMALVNAQSKPKS